jgi:hypothetical protein
LFLVDDFGWLKFVALVHIVMWIAVVLMQVIMMCFSTYNAYRFIKKEKCAYALWSVWWTSFSILTGELSKFINDSLLAVVRA